MSKQIQILQLLAECICKDLRSQPAQQAPGSSGRKRERARSRETRARFFLCPLLPSACYAGYKNYSGQSKKVFSTHSVANCPWVPQRNSLEVADQFTQPENVASARRNLSFLHLFYIYLTQFLQNCLDVSFLGGSVSSESLILK